MSLSSRPHSPAAVRRLAVAATLVLPVAVFAGSSAPAGAASTASSVTASSVTAPSVTATADAYVTAASPAATRGTGTVLRVQAAPGAQVALVRFAGIPTTTAGPVTLQVFADTSAAAGISVSPVTSAWSEQSVTWATRPTWGDAVARSGPVVSHTWVSVDVTALVVGHDTVDLAVTTPAASAITLSARESTHPPRLVLGSTARSATPAAPADAPRVFAYYYLWWSLNHWQKSLGSSYPTTARPLPLPATLDASGCNPKASYTGATVTDVPQRLYSQDDTGFIEADVREAAAAGLAGFAVNWIGSGASAQTVDSTPYSRRLQAMVDAVHKVNAEGIPFTLWLSYKASARVLSTSYLRNDLAYFTHKYGNDPAFDRVQSSRATVIWNGSRKYSVATLQSISSQFRSQLRIIGDETTWSTQRAAYLDGDAYYWSSQDPWRNPQSFQQIGALANAVRASGTNPDGSPKVWVSPLAPGYDKQLAGGTNCVPRKGGATLRALFHGNSATHPDDWALISWNEITEGTYVDPMTRYGSQDLDMMTALIDGRA